jgi:hypothetical protein
LEEATRQADRPRCPRHHHRSTVQSIHAVLRNALECTVREETIPRNVAKLVKVITPKYVAKFVKVMTPKFKVNRGLTTAQARTVLRAAADHRLHALYVLALPLGLRRGELLGLRWVDVDLDGEKLEIVQALQCVGGRLQFVQRVATARCSHGASRTTPQVPGIDDMSAPTQQSTQRACTLAR